MSDKTSQRTEEEMLDQTFVGYDEEMTVHTEDGAKGGAAKPTEEPAKKKNQNLIVYSAMGVAALGFLGFKFMGGSSVPPQPVQEPIQQAPVQAPVQTQAPVAVTTEPVQVPAPVAVPVPNTSLVTQVSSTNVVDPVAQYTGDTNNTANVLLPKTTKPEIKAEVKPEMRVDKVSVVMSNNAEATSSNEKLLAQFQDMLDRKYDPKFNKIEKSLDEQKEFNKTIEERLSRLESGKSTKVVVSNSTLGNTADASDSKVVTTVTNSTEIKPIKKIIRKPILIKHKSEAHVNKDSKLEEGDVLIDKKMMRTKPEIQKIEPVYPKVEIHSVYSGRIWTKNADGTLSTFAVGDRLPTGEIIKKIDEEKEKIITDKRVISQ